jgi:plastocyanin
METSQQHPAAAPTTTVSRSRWRRRPRGGRSAGPAPFRRTAALLAAALTTGVIATAQAAPGTIRGQVSFVGTAPPRPALDLSSDPYCAKQRVQSEDVVVTGGKLRDVLVRIKPGSAGKHVPPQKPLVIDQNACMYRPRVSGAVAGQQILLRNSDRTLHNVHAYAGKRTLFNRAQLPGAPDMKAVQPPGTEILELGCDIHRWMRAYVVISDHPFFAVTGDDGRFEIRNVPPGTYTLEAWHPVLGQQTGQVTVPSAGTATAQLSFRGK